MNLLRILSGFFFLATFFPLIKSDKWWIRVFDYPRLQKLTILILISLGWIFYSDLSQSEPWIWLGLIGIAVFYLGNQVYPFTPFGKKMIKKVPFREESGVHILAANVYQYNVKYSKLLNLVQIERPDILFFVETDSKWEKALNPLEKDYPFTIKIPLDNTYGLLFYSKLKIIRQEIHYLIDSEIPSLELDIELRNGDMITIFAIHPTPPVPGENSKSTDRDAEILIVGEKAKSSKLPSLVIGDLNDVAWSYTTELFLKISEMADPRRGRGTYNTFHAHYPIFRWPLDHVFLSKDFGLSKMKVHRNIGSDHFPISIKAVLIQERTVEPIRANGDEKKEARQKISNGLESGSKD